MQARLYRVHATNSLFISPMALTSGKKDTDNMLAAALVATGAACCCRS